MINGTKLFSAEEISTAVAKIADAIGADFTGSFDDCALVGIHQQGVPLAEMICEELKKKYGSAPLVGKLDISMYRDDIGNRKRLPAIRETDIPFDVNGSSIILVDDVLSTGRTIRAALDALTDYGRAGLIRLAVLVDRGEPEFPIRADYVGLCTTAPADRKIVVRFEEDGDPGIYAVNWENHNL
ncbi:MAG: bifunctional pyr operon transcriptional regulator/uracil phosphoribosyltransferase PyrR [Lentisphaeria bacterium]|nr:bifunctional pyr operon transcriptional regulator/uracil phosphoribosyltransferase PyrR [Lentisphaeria bacterium]